MQEAVQPCAHEFASMGVQELIVRGKHHVFVADEVARKMRRLVTVEPDVSVAALSVLRNSVLAPCTSLYRLLFRRRVFPRYSVKRMVIQGLAVTPFLRADWMLLATLLLFTAQTKSTAHA
jgi:hypothetical protein